MPPHPAVSVVIPAYRVTDYIGEALDSALAQTFQDFEIIVVNDGCPDTVRLEGVLAAYRERIVYLKQQNGGPSAARNAAIQAARADVVALLDADDVWEPNYLEFQMAGLAADPSIDVLYPNGWYFGDSRMDGQEIMKYSPSVDGNVTFAKVAGLECSVTISLVARKSALVRAGLFNPNIRRAEDFDLWLRVIAAGGRVAFHRTPLFRYRRRADSASTDRAAMRRSALEVLRNLGETLPLSAEDRAGLERGQRRLEADVHYQTARDALAKGDSESAWRGFQAANRQYRNPKLALGVLALRWFPRTAMPLLKKRMGGL